MLTALLDYVQGNRRVCPQPQLWNELWEMLPARHRVGSAWEPAPPLILAAWWESSILTRVVRLRQHIEHAEWHGALSQIDAYLCALPEEQWAHVDDFLSSSASH